MTLKRMDNILIVVDDLEAVKALFVELRKNILVELSIWAHLVRRTINGFNQQPHWRSNP